MALFFNRPSIFSKSLGPGLPAVAAPFCQQNAINCNPPRRNGPRGWPLDHTYKFLVDLQLSVWRRGGSLDCILTVGLWIFGSPSLWFINAPGGHSSWSWSFFVQQSLLNPTKWPHEAFQTPNQTQSVHQNLILIRTRAGCIEETWRNPSPSGNPGLPRVSSIPPFWFAKGCTWWRYKLSGGLWKSPKPKWGPCDALAFHDGFIREIWGTVKIWLHLKMAYI